LIKLLHLTLLSLVCFKAVASPIVSVRIGKSLKNVLVSGIDLQRHLLFNGDIKSYTGKQTVKFNCQSYQNLNSEKNKPRLLATLESKTGLINFGSEKFRGQFKVLTNPKGDSCDLVNDVPMESYIASLLNKEMNSNWPIEALKAQAVAARTYAIHKMQSQQVSKELGNNAFYDLESSEKHQVGGNFFDSTESTISASKETAGEVLALENGEINPIFFHAKCGGKTLRPDQVWKNKEKGYQAVNCPFCHSIGSKGWSEFISFERVREFLDWANRNKIVSEKIDRSITSFILVPDHLDRFTVNLYVNEKPFIIEKAQFRNYFGNVSFPSNNFYLKSNRMGLEISGEGLGHNVGMCQTGALALAKMGWSYKKILSHYFPSHVLKKLY